MNLIQEIKNKLTKYPGVRYESGASWITVFPSSDDGFEVSLMLNGGSEYMISFSAWHVDLSSPEEALNLFAMGLSDGCRLKEYRRGTFAYKWTLEYLEDGEWTEDETTALVLFPFWRKRAVRYLQNHLLTLPADADRKI
jgi:hypothetical protein